MYFFEHALDLLVGHFPALLLGLQLRVHLVQLLLDAFSYSIGVLFPALPLALDGALQVHQLLIDAGSDGLHRLPLLRSDGLHRIADVQQLLVRFLYPVFGVLVP